MQVLAGLTSSSLTVVSFARTSWLTKPAGKRGKELSVNTHRWKNTLQLLLSKCIGQSKIQHAFLLSLFNESKN
jgi:hypothetical protein